MSYFSPEDGVSKLEKVRGFPSLGKLEQIVRERRDVLRARRFGLVRRRRSRGRGQTDEGRLGAADSVHRRRRVARPQRFVRVLAGRPVHEPLQRGAEGGAEAFGREAATTRPG